MAVPGDLTSFLSDISTKDELLRKASSAAPRSGASALPIRGKEGVRRPPPDPPLQKKLPAAEALPPPLKDSAAIWDDDEAASAGPPFRAGPAAPPAFIASPTFAGARPGYVYQSGSLGVGYYADGAAAQDRVGGKTSHRKHAYEYFSEWDRFDVDGELEKLDKESDAGGSCGGGGGAGEDDGLPSGLTAEMLRDMPKVEVERRALNEKAKGNEYYKAGDYNRAVRCYTHALRLDGTNAAVFANRAVCNLKLRRYKLAVSDSDAAIQLDDGYTKAYLRRGIARRRLNQPAAALSDLDVVLSREPHNKEANEHRRCAAIEREREVREAAERAAAAGGQGAAAKAGAAGAARARGKFLIEEVDGDGGDDPDDETEIEPSAALLEQLRREREAADWEEVERAARAERQGSDAPGPFVDPEAMQQSSEMLDLMSKMAGLPLGQQQNAAPKQNAGPKQNARQEGRRLAIAEGSDSEGFSECRFEELSSPDGTAAAPVRAVASVGVAATGMRSLIIEEDSDESEEEVPIRKPSHTGGGTATAADTAAAAMPAAAAAPPATRDGAPGAMRKLAVAEVDDDEEEEEEQVAAAVAAGEEAVVAEKEEAGGVFGQPATRTASRMKKLPIVEVQDETEDETEDRADHAPSSVEAPLTPARAEALASARAACAEGTSLFASSSYEAAAASFSVGLRAIGADALAATAGTAPTTDAAAATDTETELRSICLSQRAACWCQLQRYPEALSDCDAVLSVDASNTAARMRRAFTREALEQYAGALEDCRAVMALGAGNADVSASVARLTRLAAQQKKVDEAIKAATPAPPPAAMPAPPPLASPVASAAAAGAEAAAAARARGTAAFKRCEYKQAADAYYEACRHDPGVAIHFCNLAIALLKLNQPAHAVTAARRCTELAPEMVKGWYRLGSAHLAKGDLSAARAAFERGLPLATKQEQADLRRGIADAQRALEALPAGIEEVSPAPSPVSPSAGTPAPPWSAGSPSDKNKAGKVDLGKAAETARRVAAGKAGVGAPPELSKLGFSGFERAFLTLWARGKAPPDRNADLAAFLRQLPQDESSLVGYIGDAMSEETLSALVLAAERALLPSDPPAAAGLLCRLTAVRRFGMLWMFLGSRENQAAAAVLRGASGGADAEAIRAAAGKCGVEL